MANRSDMDGVSRRCAHKYDTTFSLLLDVRLQGRALVVRPVGELTLKSYEQLRDSLVTFAAEEPAAIVVDLGHMRTTIASLLTVFPTVHDRINNWPGVPLMLVATQQPLRAMLDFSAVPRFVPIYSSVTEALTGLDAAPHRRRRQMQLPGDPTSARLARRLVEQTCHKWGIPEMTADAVVVASELTDNMVSHARSEGWLRLDLRSNSLTIAVADAEPRPPQLRTPNLDVPGGRGLVLVDKLSRTWGTAPRFSGGKVVWARLTVAPQTRAHTQDLITGQPRRRIRRRWRMLDHTRSLSRTDIEALLTRPSVDSGTRPVVMLCDTAAHPEEVPALNLPLRREKEIEGRDFSTAQLGRRQPLRVNLHAPPH